MKNPYWKFTPEEMKAINAGVMNLNRYVRIILYSLY